MKKKVDKKRLIILIVLMIILVIIARSIYSLSNNEEEENTITAIKVIFEENEQNLDIKCIIKIKDYNIERAIKEITFENEQEAELKYRVYQTVNEYERKGLELELKKKQIIITMTEEQLLQELEYKKQKTITKTENGEEKEIIDQNELKQCLINKGYIIK